MKSSSTSLALLLGLKQRHLSAILKVSRSQVSKSVLGMRGLPLGTMRLLNTMVQHMAGNPEIPAGFLQQQYAREVEGIGKMMKENDIQRQLLANKIEAAETKYQYYIRAVKTITFLSDTWENRTENESALLRHIAAEAHQYLKSNGSDFLFRLRTELEILDLKKLLIEQQARKLMLSPLNSSDK